MAFISFFKKTLTFFLLIICLRFSSVAQLPACKDSFPSSLLPNNSFEQYSGCNPNSVDYEGGRIDYPPDYGGITVNNWHSFLESSPVLYNNYNCRSNSPLSIFDTASFFTNLPDYPAVPLPLPDSSGFITIIQLNTTTSSEEIKSSKTYITACVASPLYAGQTYIFSFYFGFGKVKSGSYSQPYTSPSPFSIAIFGLQDCADFPVSKDSGGCLTNNSGWIQLGSTILKGGYEWVQGTIEFTPPTNITSIGIGPNCASKFNMPGAGGHYYMDKFVLAPKADFSFKTITALSGNPCTGNFVLKAPTYPAAAYQWYKEGIPIANATSQLYTVPAGPDAAGNYTANISLPYNTCVNTLPFTVSFSNIEKFSLGNDTTTCAPAEIKLNAGWTSGSQYLWSDGSRNSRLTVDKTGIYKVQVTDEYGCAKKDEIKVTIQGCDECEIYIPSAFTPNNDGVNDVFRALPKCTNIGFQHYKMRIYNRWGQVVFTSNNIQKGWNGTYKNISPDTGTYIYYIEYAFKQNKPLTQKGTILLLR